MVFASERFAKVGMKWLLRISDPSRQSISVTHLTVLSSAVGCGMLPAADCIARDAVTVIESPQL